MKIFFSQSNQIPLIQIQTSIFCSHSTRNHSTISLFEVYLGESVELPYICPYCHENFLLNIKTIQKNVTRLINYSNQSEERKFYIIGLISIISSALFVFIMDLFFKYIHSHIRIDFTLIEFLIMLSGITLFPFLIFFILHYFFYNSMIPSIDTYCNLSVSTNSALHRVSYQKTCKLN